MLLGHDEELALDAELRAFLARKYFHGKAPKDKHIRAGYEAWGTWQYLGYWFDRVDE